MPVAQSSMSSRIRRCGTRWRLRICATRCRPSPATRLDPLDAYVRRSCDESLPCVAGVCDAASEGLRFEQRQPRHFVPVREQPPATALHGWIQNKRYSSTSPAVIRAWHNVILPVRTMSWPGCSFNVRTSTIGSPESTVEFCHCGSVIVEETTYFRARLR